MGGHRARPTLLATSTQGGTGSKVEAMLELWRRKGAQVLEASQTRDCTVHWVGLGGSYAGALEEKRCWLEAIQTRDCTVHR